MDNNPQRSNKLNFSLDYRIIIFLLLAVIAGMLVVWKPWSGDEPSTDRTITVTGEATIKAEPDEYLFYPSYEFKSTSKETALSEQTAKNQEIIKGLKSIGVNESDIKNHSSGYGAYWNNDDNTTTYTLQLTVTVSNKELAQKVQDYLISTNPQGQITPQANFSESKRKDIEAQARDLATKDAQSKADKSANNTGAKLGKVKSIQDGSGFGDVNPLIYEGDVTSGSLDSTTSKNSLSVNPGQNDLSYNITVIYYLK
jgi:uncharacterized protein YggE